MNEQKEIVASSLSEYFDAVSSFNSNLIRNGAEKNEELLFRGHSDCAYKLLPSLGRNRSGACSITIFNEERNLIETAKSRLPDVFRNDMLPLELLALLQHENAISLSASVYKVRNQRSKLFVYSEDDKVMEGKAEVKVTVVKERSQKLRTAAIEHYTVDGAIKCAVCGFDFKETYGELGNGYIQMHHENPIYQYSDDGFETYISEAVKNMKPLCANCHCMVHRNKSKLVSITELKSIVDSNK